MSPVIQSDSYCFCINYTVFLLSLFDVIFLMISWTVMFIVDFNNFNLLLDFILYHFHEIYILVVRYIIKQISFYRLWACF